MDSFCSNHLCILNHMIVPDEQVDTEVAYPDGTTGEMVRVLFVGASGKEWFCEACANAVNMVLKGERIRRPETGITSSGIVVPGNH